MASITRAEQQDIGSYPIGSDADITVSMDPAESTSGWTIEFTLSLTRTGSAVTLTGTPSITVGGGTSGETITINLTAAITTALNGRYWYCVRRTDSGSRDRLAFGTIKFDKPNA